LEICRLKVEI